MLGRLVIGCLVMGCLVMGRLVIWDVLYEYPNKLYSLSILERTFLLLNIFFFHAFSINSHKLIFKFMFLFVNVFFIGTV